MNREEKMAFLIGAALVLVPTALSLLGLGAASLIEVIRG